MLDLNAILQAGKSWRELWLPEAINTTILPNSVSSGRQATLTGARKGSTCNGVHFNGAADSLVNCGGIHNAAAKLVISFRFKLDQRFDSDEVNNQYIFGLDDNATDWLRIWLEATTGALSFYHSEAGVLFSLNWAPPESGTPDYWEAGKWYHVLASLGQAIGGGAASDGARLRIDNGAAEEDADATAISIAADFVLGNPRDPGVGTGFEGIIADVFVMTDDVSGAEETELYKGVPPADAVNSWPLDEGRGIVANDRGSGGNNGALDTTALWNFDGQPRLAVLSLDGINDRGQSAAGINISGDLSLVWIGKMKSTYDGLGAFRQLARIYIGAGSYISLSYDNVEDVIQWYAIGGGDTDEIHYAAKPIIDDYIIFIGTLTGAGVMGFYANGIPVGATTKTGAMPGTAATAYIGSTHVPGGYDISKPVLVGLVDGVLSVEEALVLSRFFDRKLGLGIGV